MNRRLSLTLAFLSLSALASALQDGQARRPPMGWNSWNAFGCNVSDSLIREMADKIVASGMKDAGYVYVNVDDCWQVGRDAHGQILADPVRFPGGMKAVADYVHSKGLKFGLYTDAGIQTCGGRPGSLGYEAQDAASYAAWGVDYVKVDWCNTQGLDPRQRYALFRDAFAASGRPMVFSLCNWGAESPWLWGPGTGHLWRTSGDIQNCWDCSTDWGGQGFVKVLDHQVGLENYGGPGGWNDPDMLEVGNGGMSVEEDRAHFSLWCVLAAPLIAGNDIRKMSKATREILCDPELIAVDQDPAGLGGSKVWDDGKGLQVWARRLADGDRAVALFNRSATAQSMAVSFKDLGLAPGPAKVRDLWRHKDLGTFESRFASTVGRHAVVMLRISPARPVATDGGMAAPQNVISVNFCGVDGSMAPGDLAGAPASSHWNNAKGSAGDQRGLTDGLGVPGSAQIRWKAGATGALPVKEGLAGAGMMKGYLAGEISVAVTGIPARFVKRGYRVIAYADGESAKDDLKIVLKIGDEARALIDGGNANYCGSYVVSPDGSLGNAVAFSVSHQPQFTLVVTSADKASKKPAALNGIQIIAEP